MPSRSAIDVNFERLWVVAEWARARGSLSRDDIAFVRDTLPAALDSFPRIKLPKTIRHPGGFTVSGAPVGTFLRSALLIAGQKALGRRFAGHSFFENVERDLALGVMRSHFHHEYPKGTHWCSAPSPYIRFSRRERFDISTAPRWQSRSGRSFASVSGDSPDR